MTKHIFLVFLFFFLCHSLMGQRDSITELEEINISDALLRKFTNTQSVLKLNDSVLKKSSPSLTQLLNFNTGIYFKEYGLGMTSSPSFRGTTGAQTAVIWNGININSQLLGQTDFNTLNATDFSSVSIRNGGGSVIYGSGAIGGSIHLNSDGQFKKIFQNNFRIEYGSFSTSLVNYSLKAATDKIYNNISITRYDSENDYKILETNRINSNGQFYNTSANVNFGYCLSPKNYIKFYSQFFEGQRNLSLVFSTETPTKYKNLNTRNLLEWDTFYGKMISKLKLAFLSEEYNYFPNINKETFSFGKVESIVAKYDLFYNLTNKMKLNSILDFTQNKGKGSEISYETRQIGAVNLMFKHSFGKFLYEVSARKEITKNYSSPFLYSIGLKSQVANWYALRINNSKNFRIPSFDDLYWVEGGNRNLKPETSQQFELGHDLTFKNLSAEFVGFYNYITNMIRWVPAGSFWTPVNVDKVETYGMESRLKWLKKIGKHQFTFSGTYAYTISKDLKTTKQLIYVPYHKGTLALGYNFRKFSAYYQNMYVGEVFTRTDNNPIYNLKDYNVSNFGFDFDFGRKEDSYKVGLKIQNVWNEKYEVVDGRIMPGRYYTIYMNLKI